MKRLTKSCLLSALFVVWMAFVSANAQVDSSTATLKGSVVDPQGAVVAGATVTVTNTATGISKSVKTQEDGAYQITALPPGTYQVTFEAQGFSREVAKGLQLTVGQHLVYDGHMKVGLATETVEVSADNAPVIQVEQTQQANTINFLQVAELPNIARNITQAVYTLPGVSNSEATRSQTPGFTGFATTGFSIGGSNGRNNLSTIDGGENEYGTGQYRVTTIPVDAIQEFQVNRNGFAAEFGFTNGSAINIVTKSGGNRYHGSLYGYFRNHSTEATNFFNNLAGLPKAFDQRVYTGANLGGPIKQDRLFFFMNYEYQRLDLPDFTSAGIINAPTVLGLNAPGLGANCAGQFVAKTPDQVCYVNALKTSGDPFLVGFANGITPGLVPLNNPALAKILNRDSRIFDAPFRRHNAIVRFDAQPNSANSLNLRFGYLHNNSDTLNPDSSGLHTRDFSVLSSWVHTFSPGLVNQVLVQVVPRNIANNVPNPFTGVNFSLGNLSIGGLGGTSSLGSPSLVPYLAHQKRYQFEDSITWITGPHTFKFGASQRLADYHVEDDLWFNNQFDFRDGAIPLISLAPAAVQGHLVAFNLGQGLAATGPISTNLTAPQAFSFGVPVDVLAGFNNPKWSGWGKYFGSFIQDSWKLNSRLTMNAGVRFDVDGEPLPLGNSFYASPRLGFAWDPFGDHKTVVRASGGIYVAPIDVLIPSYGSLLDGSGKYINEVLSILSATNPQPAALWQRGIALGELPFGRLTPADFAAVGINTTTPGATVGYGVDPNYKNPYSVQASLSVDRELVKNLSLELGYNMYHAVHLQMPLETAYTEIPAGGCSPTILASFPGCVDATGGPLYAPTTGQLQHTTYESIGSSIYHGLTASLTKRYSNHLQFQVNYTWSKTIDNAIDFASFQNWFRPSRLSTYRAVSVFDVPHILVANAVYTTPFRPGQGNFLARALTDITLAPVVTVESGLPFSVRTPSLVNKVNGQTLDNNFAMPFGATRDANRGAVYATTDMRFTKAFFINRDRGLRVDVIAEGTNIFNRVNFNKVSDNFPLTYKGPFAGLHGVVPQNIGEVTKPGHFASADQARQVQFGLKLAF
jgi:hypothetical protein